MPELVHSWITETRFKDMKQDIGTSLKIQVTLGIAVIAVALVGLAPPTAQAQNPTNNVAQVNPYADIYSEDDCRDARDQANGALMVEHYRRIGNLAERRKKLLEDSEDIFLDEVAVISAEQRRKLDDAQSKYENAMGLAQWQFIACQAGITAVVGTPAFWAAERVCIGRYLASMAAAVAVYKTVEKAASEAYQSKQENIRLRANARDEDIERVCLVRSKRIERWHERRLAAIESDYQECLEFVGAGN